VKSITLILVLLLGLVTTAMAETRYVSDRLDIQMRTGKGTKFRILHAGSGTGWRGRLGADQGVDEGPGRTR